VRPSSLFGPVLVAVVLVACGPAGPAASPTSAPAKAPAPVPPAAPGSAASPAAEVKPAAPAAAASPAASAAAVGSPLAKSAPIATLKANAAEWDRIKEAGKKEGKVVVSGPGFPGLRTGVTEAFQKAYGITVEYLGLGPGEVITRVDREAKANNVTIDANIGGTSSCWTMGDRGQIDEASKLMVDPSLFDASLWRGGQLRIVQPSPGMPKDYYCGLQTAEWVMTDLFVNRNMVPPAGLTSWKDLLKPEYKGKIASFDPRRAGSAQTTVAYLYTLFGEQYVKDLFVGQSVTLTADYGQLAEWVARGSYPIGMSLVQANIEPLRGQGLPLERAFPSDGQGALTGGFGTVHKIKGGPNPNAAAVFMNWFASKDAQDLWEREMMETSLRTDAAHKVPDYVIPRAGVQYPINDYDVDYYFSKRAPAIARMQDILGR
jgi:ABC-type Fe3+ transport system substrate-binding protein